MPTKKLPRWEVMAREEVYYLFFVEAETEEQAWDEAINYTVNLKTDVVDSDYFEVDTVTKVESRKRKLALERKRAGNSSWAKARAKGG